jgi:hypothetical protein
VPYTLGDTVGPLVTWYVFHPMTHGSANLCAMIMNKPERI